MIKHPIRMPNQGALEAEASPSAPEQVNHGISLCFPIFIFFNHVFLFVPMASQWLGPP